MQGFIGADPTDARGSDTMKGYPNHLEAEVSRLSRTQNLLPVLGCMYTGLTVLILVTQMFC